MMDQDHLQKTIRAYMSFSMVMRSDTLSPKTKELVRDLIKNLEAELSKLRETTTTPKTLAA